MKRLMVVAGLAAACFGQVNFFSLNGTQETALTGVYSLPGPFIVGVPQTIVLRARNQSTTQAACIVRNASALGYGFTLDLTNNPSLPSPVTAGGFLDFKLTFVSQVAARSASASVELQYAMQASGASCSGPNAPTPNLKLDLLVQVNSIVSGAVISLTQGGPAISTLNFGNVVAGTPTPPKQTIYIANPSSNALTINSSELFTSVGVYTIVSGPAFPLTLNPTEFATMVIQFMPITSASVAFTGSLTFDWITIALTGYGVAPAFPAPTIVVDPQLASASQPGLKITLANPAPGPGSGTLRLDFKPSAGTLDDSSIQFIATQSRVISFNFKTGDTVATIGASGNTAPFQTGTTAGTLTFTVTLQGANYTATSTIAPALAVIDATIANRPNLVQMVVQLNGFDNSKSISTLTFAFYDTKGVIVPPGTITYDATKDFSQFYSTSTAGGLFSLLASFPVNGSNTNVASVNITITNSQGTVTLQPLKF